MAFPEVVQTLCDEAKKPENRGYSDNGGEPLKAAAARYLRAVCGVEVDRRDAGHPLHRQQAGAWACWRRR